MNTDAYENCLKTQYNLDSEAVQFIVKILELGSQEVLKWLKDNWAKIAAASGIISAIAKYGGKSAVVQFLTKTFEKLGADIAGAVIDVLAAMVLGLAFGAIILALDAGVECLPSLDQAAS